MISKNSKSRRIKNGTYGMSEEDDKKTCYFKGYTSREDYSCPLRIGLCGCDDCSILASAIKGAIKEFIEQKQSEIENQEVTKDSEESVVFELSCDEDKDD